jgi:ATP-dependent helicase/nuclease subunit B
MISGKSVKPRAGNDPRIHIWGALEARLQPVETMILGGLNEKVWPARPSDDPFLSRGMRAGIDLGPPERRTGLAAHDFQMLAGTRRLILTRSARQEGAPSVASRWLQRLHAAAGEGAVKAMLARGQRYLDLAHLLDWRKDVPRATRPNPAPPVDIRPRRFSVTEVETLIRDPYAIHARKTLGLEPLDGLLREPDAPERGILFHAIAETFVKTRRTAPGTLDELRRIGRELFDKECLPPEIELSWWRRFERMAGEFIAFENARYQDIASSHVECKADATSVGATGVVLSGRADRIDVMKDGSAQIIDYKTGSTPTIAQAYQLYAPQLALEAALLRRKAFAGVGKTEASDLVYVRMKASGEVKAESVLKGRKKDDPELSADDLGEKAWEKLDRILEGYRNKDKGYISRRAPFKDDLSGDYDHLARAAEWTSGGDKDGGEDA